MSTPLSSSQESQQDSPVPRPDRTMGRLFKGSTGLPPHQFVARQRIASAVALLETQQHSIAQASQRVGFRTVSHFTTVFRRVTGMTPGTFRVATLRDSRPGPEGESDGLA